MLRTAIAGCLLLATVVGPTDARANTIHAPGTACHPKKDDVSKINYNTTSVINENTSTANVVCPLHAEDGQSTIAFSVFAIDRSSGNISCKLTAFADANIAAGAIFQDTLASSGASSTVKALQGIDGSAIDLQGLDDQFNFTMTCSIPGGSSSSNRSEIVSYRLSLF